MTQDTNGTVGRFTLDPDTMRAKGLTMLEQSGMFEQKIKDVYNTVHQMVAKDYTSDSAKAIAREIDSYRIMLEDIPKIIAAYGEYCINASKDTIIAEESIIAGTKGGY